MARGKCIEDNPEILTKLENAFSMGCTDDEACIMAGISRGTLYYYIKANPDFHDRKEELKQLPTIQAKHVVVGEIKDSDVKTSKWYLERKTQEFRPPDKNTNVQLNQFNLLTDAQIKDRLVDKLNKLLSGPGVTTG